MFFYIKRELSLLVVVVVVRGRGSSFDRSRLARRMANLDNPALPTAEQGVGGNRSK